MKNFLKPTVGKIVLALVLLLVSSILWRMLVVFFISDTFPIGFPFQFLVAWGPCPPGQNCSEFSNLSLILDLVIWYLASALMIGRPWKKA